MPRLIAALIRHGDYHQQPDTPSAHQPFPLNPDGEAHACESARRLRDTLTDNAWQLITDIDSSRLLRAWQTAHIIANELIELCPSPPEVGEFDALAERGLGSAANLTVREIEAALHADPRYTDPPAGWKADSHYRLPLPGAESLLEAGERVAAHLQERMASLAEAASADCLKLFVGHGAAFRHAAYHLGVLKFDQLARLSMFHDRPVYIEYHPEGHWQHVGGEWKIRTPGVQAMD